jgi:hypothetical protein
MFGISFTPPAATPTINGASAKQTIQGLQVKIDLTTFHDALNKVPVQALIDAAIPASVRAKLCVPDQGQLPFGSCLDDQINAVFGANPTVVFIAGNTFGGANASKPFLFVPPPFSGGTPPTTTTIPGTPGTPGTSGTPALGGTSAPQPQVAGTPGNFVTRQFPLGYAGLKGAILLALLAAVGAWYLMRNLGLAVVGGLAGCEYGAPRSVPDLRGG